VVVAASFDERSEILDRARAAVSAWFDQTWRPGEIEPVTGS
jgi:hypothetical protein